MIRDLKALGLSLVAIFAMGAVVASAASAQQGKLTSDGPVTLHTKENAGGVNKLTAFGGTYECPGTVLTGHKLGSTVQGISNGEMSFTISPDYGPCYVQDSNGNNFPATIDMGDPSGNCDFIFHVGETTLGEATNSYGIRATVVCKNTGEHIKITWFSSPSHALRVCTITLTSSMEGLTGPHITTNTVSDDIDIKGTFGLFTAHKSGLCGAGEDKDRTLHISATITGKNAAGGATGITITDPVV